MTLIREECNKTKIKYREFIRIGTTTIPFKIPQLIEKKDIDIIGEFSADAYTDNTFFGTFNMKMLKFEADNDIDYKGKEFEYYKQVNDELIKIGTFVTTEVKNNDTTQTVSVTAYDYALKFANNYQSDLNFETQTITLKQVLDECCEKCDIELENENLINGNLIIKEKPSIDGLQFGNVISYIASIEGKFATINENDKLEFILQKVTDGESNILLTESEDYLVQEDGYLLLTNENELIEDYTELDDKRDTRPITCILVALDEESVDYGGVAKDIELVQQYGENWYKIIGNPLITSTNQCIEVANNLLNNLKGFGYTAFESRYTFKPYYKLGDIVKIKRQDGTIEKSNIFRITSNYDNITLQAPSIIKSSVEYELPPNNNQRINDALISLDKTNAQIVMKATSDGKLVQAELNADAESGSEFNISADNINFEGKTFNLGVEDINITSNNFSVDNQGNVTANNLISNNATITGGDIELKGTSSQSKIRLIRSDDENRKTLFSPNNMQMLNGETIGIAISYILSSPLIQLYNGTDTTQILASSITTPIVYQTSREEMKKNFELYENALKEIVNTDIYRYNLKNEKDVDKKHIGFVIGENRNYSHDITWVKDEKETGVDIYSMISVLWQGVKEQQVIIENLQNEIKKLKEEYNGK